MDHKIDFPVGRIWAAPPRIFETGVNQKTIVALEITNTMFASAALMKRDNNTAPEGSDANEPEFYQAASAAAMVALFALH
jgi:hypothetical protein